MELTTRHGPEGISVSECASSEEHAFAEGAIGGLAVIEHLELIINKQIINDIQAVDFPVSTPLLAAASIQGAQQDALLQ